jgi:Tol biopolymer transport system component
MPRSLPQPALLILAIVGLALGCCAPGARAAFPGDNGRIAFTADKWRVPPNCPRNVPHACDPTSYSAAIETVLPSGRDRRVLFNGEGGATTPVWSPSGRALAFHQTNRLAIIRADGTGFRRLPRLTSGELFPAWSPDGRRLAFTGSAICCNWLYSVRTNGTGLRRLRAHEAMGSSWSVRGTIAFTSSAGLYTVRSDGSRLRRLTGPTSRPDWSPDGRRIAFSRRDRLVTIGSDGRGPRRLATGMAVGPPAWSPDGRYLAFVRDGDLYVVRSNGRGLHRILDVGEFDPDDPEGPWTELGPPSWQPRPRAGR